MAQGELFKDGGLAQGGRLAYIQLIARVSFNLSCMINELFRY